MQTTTNRTKIVRLDEVPADIYMMVKEFQLNQLKAGKDLSFPESWYEMIRLAATK